MKEWKNSGGIENSLLGKSFAMLFKRSGFMSKANVQGLFVEEKLIGLFITSQRKASETIEMVWKNPLLKNIEGRFGDMTKMLIGEHSLVANIPKKLQWFPMGGDRKAQFEGFLQDAIGEGSQKKWWKLYRHITEEQLVKLKGVYRKLLSIFYFCLILFSLFLIPFW